MKKSDLLSCYDILNSKLVYIYIMVIKVYKYYNNKNILLF